jgi:hypothetical protein
VPVLEFLAKQDRWVMRYPVGKDSQFRSITEVMPPEAPEKLQLAKMDALILRKLVDGCTCGCRGDFEITDKGRALLAQCQQPVTQ